MRSFVNGDEVELHRTAVEVQQVGDRLMVRTPEGSFSALAVRHGSVIHVSFKGRQYRVEERRRSSPAAVHPASGELRAAMPGQIVDVRRSVGDPVRKGDTILILEAMKTQQPVVSPFDGTIGQITVARGEQVQDGILLAVVEAIEQPHE
jgi:biotin carboxyl carrier protein